MTYLDLIRGADRKLDTGKITLGEYEEMIEPLKREIQPEREKGRWIDMDDHVMCSCCGATHYGVDKNYCPNCGADMGGGETT